MKMPNACRHRQERRSVDNKASTLATPPRVLTLTHIESERRWRVVAIMPTKMKMPGIEIDAS